MLKAKVQSEEVDLILPKAQEQKKLKETYAHDMLVEQTARIHPIGNCSYCLNRRQFLVALPC